MGDMLHRLLFRGWTGEGGAPLFAEAANSCAAGAKKLIDSGKAMTVGLFILEGNLFWYAESFSGDIDPGSVNAPLESFLEARPGKESPASWAPLMDVFHFNAPESVEHWARKEPVELRRGRMARLKPDMVASYIYYHYQLQEERGFPGPKYEIIGIHENVLFGYQEFPAIKEAPIVPGKLSTHGTPPDWNDAHMERHFQAWPDGQLYFKPMETLYVF
jgi:hypothetical protein